MAVATPYTGVVSGLVYTLGDEEVMLACERATRIVGDDVARGWRMYFQPGTGESRLDGYLRGFAAEIAASRITGLPLNERLLDESYRRSRKPPDIGRRTEVRSTLGSRLFVYDSDPIRRCVVLLTGDRFGPFVFRGWIEAVDAQRRQFWKVPPSVRYPAFVIPADDLRPLPLPPDA